MGNSVVGATFRITDGGKHAFRRLPRYTGVVFLTPKWSSIPRRGGAAGRGATAGLGGATAQGATRPTPGANSPQGGRRPRSKA